LIFVTGEIVVEDGAVELVREALHSMEQETRKEAGCLTYAFSQDINDPNMVRIFERWESMDALQAHFGMPHMATFQEAITRITPKSANVKAWDVVGEVALPG
jgi:quinol monooxygenase YgiN